MLAWLWKLLIGNFAPDHQHQYEIIKEDRVVITNRFDSRIKRHVGYMYTSRCKTCGHIKFDESPSSDNYG